MIAVSMSKVRVCVCVSRAALQQFYNLKADWRVKRFLTVDDASSETHL